MTLFSGTKTYVVFSSLVSIHTFGKTEHYSCDITCRCVLFLLKGECLSMLKLCIKHRWSVVLIMNDVDGIHTINRRNVEQVTKMNSSHLPRYQNCVPFSKKCLLTIFTRSRWIASNSPPKRGSFRSRLSPNRNNTFLRSSKAPRVSNFSPKRSVFFVVFGGSNFRPLEDSASELQHLRWRTPTTLEKNTAPCFLNTLWSKFGRKSFALSDPKLQRDWWEMIDLPLIC